MGTDGLLSRYGPEIADASEGEHVEAELKTCQVEAITSVCRTPEEVLTELTAMRAELSEAAVRRGLRILPSGCPVMPETEQQEITPNPRYLRMADWFGATVRSVATCGCHVHVGIPDRETGVRIINQTRPWLPVLLTITANSPFDGADTGYASWRYQEWSRWPSAGAPPLFSGLDEYESTVDSMLRCGALMDRAMIYWDIRLSERHPTVEFRISDVAVTATHATLFATLVRGLVAHALDTAAPPPQLPQTILRANLWRASREGLSGSALHPVTGEMTPVQSQLDDLVELLAPVLGEDLEFVKAGVAHLRERGTGAARQRAAYNRRGELIDVVDALTGK
ncbi:carboxylate-amine ligase [Actinophytocola oryzae]|uniref:Putative glutamate--cysteine ligase 2 n=1 Tax=Actinophytocola oryzae TaxID=502181 RepID=A0A4R7VVI4_9PSEU|nr:carboxylate-amine ligase [Actinophytocola oryzae]